MLKKSLSLLIVLFLSHILFSQDIPDTSIALFQQCNEKIKNGSTNSKDYYSRGVIYASIGDNENAYNDYTKAIELNDQSDLNTIYSAYNNRGSIYQLRKEYQLADKDFDAALTIKPFDGLTLNNKGYLNMVQGKTDDAIAFFKTSIKSKPNNPKPYVNLVDIYMDAKAFSNALSTLNLLIQNIPDPKSYIHRADYYQAMGQIGLALADWNNAVEDAKGDPDYLIERSKFKDNIGDDMGAVEDCLDAIKINPNKSSYYYALARPYYDLEEYGEVLSNCRKAIEIDPNNTDALIMQANVKDMYGMHAEAVEDYKKAIAISPNNYDGYKQIAVAFVVQEKYDSALVYIDRFLKDHPDHLELIEHKGRTLVSKGDLKGSIDVFKQLIQKDTLNPIGYRLLGHISDSLGIKDEACTYIKKAYDLGMKTEIHYLSHHCPDLLDPNLLTQYRLIEKAFEYESKRLFSKAIEVYDELIKIAPDTAAYYYNRGKQKRYLEQYSDAIKDYEKGLSLEPNNVDFLISKAICQELLGKRNDAISTYENALKVDSTSAMTYYNLGRLYASENNFDLGIQFLSKAIDYNINYALAYLALGECYAITGVESLACESFKKAEQLGIPEAFGKRVRYCTE